MHTDKSYRLKRAAIVREKISQRTPQTPTAFALEVTRQVLEEIRRSGEQLIVQRAGASSARIPSTKVRNHE